MNTQSIMKAQHMKRILSALAMLACIGFTVSAQTYRPLTGTRLLLNSAAPTGGALTLQASPSASYSITLPSASPSANTILANGSTAGTLEWLSPLDMYVFENGLTESGSNTIELGGTLTKATIIDLSNRTLTLSSSSTNGNVTINTAGAFSLTSSGLNVSSAGVISSASGNISSTGNFVSTVNNNYDLGSESLRWKTGYFAPSGVHVGTSSGSTELNVGYNVGTGTAHFDVDDVTNLLTLHKTDGLKTSGHVTLGNDDATDVLVVNATIRPIRDSSSLVFEGKTINAHELTIAVIDPTADRTISFPDASGVVALAGTDGGVVVTGSLTVLQTTQLNGNLTFGDGLNDSIRVNTGPGADLYINETQLRRADELTLEGADPDSTSWVSSLQLSRGVDLRSTDGSITLNSETANVTINAANTFEFGHASSAAERSSLTMDPNTVLLENDIDLMSWRGYLEIETGLGSPTVTLASNSAGSTTSIEISNEVTLAGGDVNLNADENFNTNINTGTSTGLTTIGNSGSSVVIGSISTALKTSIGSNDRVVVANSSGTLDQISVSDLVGSASWSLTGNAPTNGTHFLGTTGAQRLEIRTNGTERMRIESDGKVLIGTTSGTRSLEVAGTVGLNASSNSTTDINTGTSTGAVNIGNSGSTITVLGPTNINTTGTQATTIGSTDATVSVLGGLKVSVKTITAAGNHDVEGNTVVIVTGGMAVNDQVRLPAGDEGRIVIVRNNMAAANTIDVASNGGGAVLFDNVAGGTNLTLIYAGGTWYQIGQ